MSTHHFDHIIQSAGFELVRDRKHRIYRHSELNKILVTASTPSDRRAEANIIAQVAKLTGRKKSDLLGVGNKRKAKSTSVVIVPPMPASMVGTVAAPPHPVVEEGFTTPAPLTANERKYLRRLEKHELQRTEKDEKLRKRFECWVAAVRAHLLQLVEGYSLTHDKDKIGDEYEKAAVRLYLIARRAGHHEAEFMIGDCKTDGCTSIILVIRVGRHYLDLFSNSVRYSPCWTIELGESAAQVEVWGSLRIEEKGNEYEIRESEV